MDRPPPTDPFPRQLALLLGLVLFGRAAVGVGWAYRLSHQAMTRPSDDPPREVRPWWSVFGDDAGAITRTVVVPGDNRVRAGDLVTVVGVLEVIRHPAAVVNGVNVPGWDEVRVTGWRER